jgi:hypothetical protein
MRLTCLFLAVVTSFLWAPPRVEAELKVGAAVLDVTPAKLPVLVNGGMLSRTASTVKTKLHARAIVLDDRCERIAIVVVDSCMMPRPLLDEAKQRATQLTKIRADRIVISATHTHTAPSSMSCLGTNADPSYVPFLRERLAEVIQIAESRLEPARVGWGVGQAAEFTAIRRWVRRPDRVEEDPFGNPTVRANMHAASNWDDVTGQSGPEDPDLSLIAFQTLSGRPIAVLANFSMHYFGDQALSADYFGLFCGGLESRLGSQDSHQHPAMVAIMSHNCSGDIWRRDYSKPAVERGDELAIGDFADGLVNIAMDVYGKVEYQKDVDLAMSEARQTLNYRVPDQQRLEWARRIVEAMGDRLPKDRTEVYAREQIILHERQSTEVVVQALRIGGIAIATTPNETYALTGLKLKLQSPLTKTMIIELANGGDGYIPPPEQHFLGGYNTWPARSAGLEVQAEPKITEMALQQLEEVTGQPRKVYQQSQGTAATRLLSAKPAAYWRLDEFSGPRAVDSSGNNRDAFYEPGIVFFLDGPQSHLFCRDGEVNRAAHFAGGRLQSRIAALGNQYSVSLWIWNGMPTNARAVTGWMFSRDHNHGISALGDHLGVGGIGDHAGKLVFQQGTDQSPSAIAAGRTALNRWSWNHVLFVRDKEQVKVFLNGNQQPEIEMKAPAEFPPSFDQLFFGGRSDNRANWEGRLDEIVVFPRAVTIGEL